MRRSQAEKYCDFDDFTSNIHSLLKAAWGSDWGIFTEEFPNGTDPQNVKAPIITYSLKSMEPGMVGNNVREIKPRHRQDFIEVDKRMGRTKAVSVYGQVMDCTVVFEIWEETNEKANKLAKRFSDFMRIYTGYLMQQGAGQIIFLKRNNRSESTPPKDTLLCRHFEYLVRLEEHTIVPNHVIEEVIGRVQVVDDISSDSSQKPYTDFK